jgi:hypothetical protein
MRGSHFELSSPWLKGNTTSLGKTLFSCKEQNLTLSVYLSVTKSMKLHCKIRSKPRMTIPLTPVRIRTCYVLKLIMSLKVGKASVIGGMWAPSQKASNVTLLTNSFNPRFRLSCFPKFRKETNVVTLLKPNKDLTLLDIYVRLSSSQLWA